MLKVHLHDDEILTSFVSRSARANGVERMRSFCADLGVSLSKIKIGEPREVAILADRIGMTPDRLIRAAVERDQGTRIRIGIEWFDNSRLSRMHLRFCPDCVEADLVRQPPGARSGPYYRFHWLFPQVTTCVRHRKEIIEAPQPRRLESNSQDFCAIVDQLRKQNPEYLRPGTDRVPTLFETYIFKRLTGENSGQSSVDAIPLETVIVMSENIGAAIVGSGVAKRTLSAQQISEARQKGFSIIENGRESLLAGLDLIAERAAPGSCTPHGLYGALYTALDRSRLEPSYNSFRSVMAEHATMTGRISPGASMFGTNLPSRAARVRSVAADAGVAIGRVKRALKGKGLPAPKSAAGLVNPTAAAAAKEHFSDVFSLKDARLLLGCNLRTFHSLLAAEIIARPSSGLPQGFVSRRTVVDLAHRLGSCRTIDDDPQMVDISGARTGGESSVAEILRYILDRRLPSVAVIPNLPILAAIRVRLDEVRKAHLPDGHVTADAARELLRLNTTGFADLLKNGLIRAKALAYPREKWWAVPLDEIERFRASYISLQECAEERALSKNAMASLAKRAGLMPAFSPHLVGQKIFFERKLAGLSSTISF